VDPTDIQRAVLPHERAHTTHVISVIAEFVPPETVDIRVEDVVDGREAVQILALVGLRTSGVLM
jgi:hypothetical protein